MTAEESSDKKMPPNEAESAVSNAAATKMDPETEPLNAGATADPKVKFTGGSETVDVEKGGLSGDDGIKPALTKAELMKYASDPFWVRLRWILFVLFWVGWTGMLVTSIVIIIKAPKCPSPAPKSWWQKRPLYQIDVEAFNVNLKGILEKAAYLDNDLGVGSIGLSPIFKSSDLKDVDEKFGTLDDFQKLVEGMHDREIKVILDLHPSHTAEQTKELLAVMQFWIDKGVDGFRVPTTGYVSDSNQIHDLEQTLALLQDFRTLLDGDEENPKILMTNVAPSIDISKLYGVNVTDQVGSLSQMPVSDESFLPDAITAENLKKSIEKHNKTLPENAWPNYSLGKGGKAPEPQHVDALNILLMMLPGTPITYFGEENGSGGVMKWDAEAAAVENSHVKIYHQASSLRDDEALLFGAVEMRVKEDVFVLARLKKGNPGYLFITNFGKTDSIVSVRKSTEAENKNPLEIPNMADKGIQIPYMADKGILTIGAPKNPDLPVGASINMAEIPVPPGTSYLITFVPDF